MKPRDADSPLSLSTFVLLSAALLLSADSSTAQRRRREQPREAPPLKACSAAQLEEFRDLEAEPSTERRKEAIKGGLDPRYRALLPRATDLNSCRQGIHDFGLDQDGRVNDGVHSWLLAAPCKLSVCGKLDGFESNLQTPWLSGEFDLNHNLVDLMGEADAFLDRLDCDRVPGQTGRAELGDPAQKAAAKARIVPEVLRQPQEPSREQGCIEKPGEWWLHVEITPPTGLRAPLRALWYEPGAWAAWRASVADQTLCVSGPLVVDTNHYKVEIHPAQLYWWREAPGRDDLVPGNRAMFVIQDASSRFNKDYSFVTHEAIPEEGRWRPWAQGPVYAQFQMPFRVRSGQSAVFSLLPYFESKRGELAACLRKSDDPKRRCDSLELARLASGTAPVQVEWLKPGSPDAVEVKRDFACLDPGGDVVGVFAIEVKTGRDREWREGALAYRLLDSRAPDDVRDFHSLDLQRPSKARWTPVEPGESERLRADLLRDTGWPRATLRLGDTRALRQTQLVVGSIRLGPDQVGPVPGPAAPPDLALASCGTGALMPGDTWRADGSRRFQITLGPNPVRCLMARVRLKEEPWHTTRGTEGTTPAEALELRFWSHGLFAPSAKDAKKQWETEWMKVVSERCLELAPGNEGAAEEAASRALRLAEDGILTGDELQQVAKDAVEKCKPSGAGAPTGSP